MEMKVRVQPHTRTDPNTLIKIRVRLEGLEHEIGVALATFMLRHPDREHYIQHFAAIAVRRLLRQVCGEKMEAELREIMTKIADELPPEENG